MERKAGRIREQGTMRLAQMRRINMMTLNRFARRTLQAAALAVVAVTAATVPLKPAAADDEHRWHGGGSRFYGNVYLGGPAYYGPPPAYYAPPPVYYAPPPPVYYAPPPPPVYYGPPALGLNLVLPLR
jgi:hypothetical protein